MTKSDHRCLPRRGEHSVNIPDILSGAASGRRMGIANKSGKWAQCSSLPQQRADRRSRGHGACRKLSSIVQHKAAGMPSDATGATVVTALFDDSPGVEHAVEIAVAKGYEINDLNVVMSEDTRRRFYADDRVLHNQITRQDVQPGLHL
jgi:hypothetical protein